MSSVEGKLAEILHSLKENVDILKEEILPELGDVDKAHLYIREPEKSNRLLQVLFDLQRIHSVVLGLHPSSFYSEQKKSSEIYDRVVSIAEETSRFIDVALDVYQCINSQAITPYFLNKELCYCLINNQIAGTFSFKGLIMRIISNCEKLLPFLESLELFEYIKGYLDTKRLEGMGKIFELKPPPKE